MTDAIIDRINPSDVELVTHLYNALFRPQRDEAWLRARLEGRQKVLIQVARVESDAVGFYVGYELRPGVHYSWIVGVVPEMRRTGIASQLMHAAEDWARTEGQQVMRFECPNQIRPFMHFGIAANYDIVGIRYDSELLTNLVIFEKHIGAIDA